MAATLKWVQALEVEEGDGDRTEIGETDVNEVSTSTDGIETHSLF